METTSTTFKIFTRKITRDMLKRMMVLADALGVDIREVYPDPHNPDDQFYVAGKLYEVVTKKYALMVAKEYARENNTHEVITDTQIEYWSPTKDDRYWYREM